MFIKLPRAKSVFEDEPSGVHSEELPKDRVTELTKVAKIYQRRKYKYLFSNITSGKWYYELISN